MSSDQNSSKDGSSSSTPRSSGSPPRGILRTESTDSAEKAYMLALQHAINQEEDEKASRFDLLELDNLEAVAEVLGEVNLRGPPATMGASRRGVGPGADSGSGSGVQRSTAQPFLENDRVDPYKIAGGRNISASPRSCGSQLSGSPRSFGSRSSGSQPPGPQSCGSPRSFGSQLSKSSRTAGYQSARSQSSGSPSSGSPSSGSPSSRSPSSGSPSSGSQSSRSTRTSGSTQPLAKALPSRRKAESSPDQSSQRKNARSLQPLNSGSSSDSGSGRRQDSVKAESMSTATFSGANAASSSGDTAVSTLGLGHLGLESQSQASSSSSCPRSQGRSDAKEYQALQHAVLISLDDGAIGKLSAKASEQVVGLFAEQQSDADISRFMARAYRAKIHPVTIASWRERLVKAGCPPKPLES